ncbi:hypothetical protein ABR737_01785 [Streptomyces sp. Edi2]|uniref:hypothetical protein n=1 Tax=Streptomyces sp. Edi2 TaxID=3162528 RepID=UPI00330582F4
MNPGARPAVWRFADRDTVRTADGTTWHRGLRRPRSWAALGSDLPERDDEAVRALLGIDPHAVFAPAGPDAYTALPGHVLDTPQALALLDVRPATGATLYRHSLDRTGAFLGSNPGRRGAPGAGPASRRRPHVPAGYGGAAQPRPDHLRPRPRPPPRPVRDRQHPAHPYLRPDRPLAPLGPGRAGLRAALAPLSIKTCTRAALDVQS